MADVSAPVADMLRGKALRVRERIIRMGGLGGAFVGSALSCADILVALYSEILNISPHNVVSPDRDYFLLSKGHAVPALYAVLAEQGFIDDARLANHLSTGDLVYWHPNTSVPGVEFHSGSLGHLLAVAVGIALDCKMAGTPNKIVVLAGDGELNEGSNWEAVMLANAYRLDNLLLIIDRNGMQANRTTEDLIPLEPLDAKFRAFGLSVETVDGHDLPELCRVLSRLPFERGRPGALIALTKRGKGVPMLESRIDRWFCAFSRQEADDCLKNLRESAL